MLQPVLTNENRFPTEKVIFSHIGKSKALWILLFDHIHQNHPDFTEQWRYYLDGKSWLLKVSRKSKTIFWLSIVEGSFRTTFYFTDKADEAISRSTLSDELKKQYKSGKSIGKIRGLTVQFKSRRDVKHATQLVDIKTSLK